MKTLGQILNPLRILGNHPSLDIPVSGISVKAQRVEPQQVFFAIKGAQFDSHSLVRQAIEQGAAAIVVEDPNIRDQYPDRTVVVDCTRSQLAEAASAWFDAPSEQLNLVGITGTNGKTTCSFLLRKVWEESRLVTGLIGTVETTIGKRRLNSVLTTPGPLELQAILKEMVDDKVSHAVMEVSSIALHQKRVLGCRFTAGIFTNLTQDHLDYHGTLENYFNCKLQLFTDFGLPLAVINIDDEWCRRVLVQGRAKRVLTFSLRDATADFYAEPLNISVDGTEARIKTPLGVVHYQTALMGAHNLSNLLAVLATHYGLGGNLQEALNALQSASGAPGRLERVMFGSSYPKVFVDYAHTEDALENAIQALLKLKSKKSRLITVFGCGGDRDKTKRPHMARVASSLSDLTVVTSDNPRTEDPDSILSDIRTGILSSAHCHFEVNRKSAIEWALREANSEDLVLIAGKGHETYQIIGTTQFPFDDREVVREYYLNAQ